MTPEDQKLADKAHALVQDRQRKYFLDRAASLRTQAAKKVTEAAKYDAMAKALEPPPTT